MAIVTGVATGDMGRMLAGGDSAIVAGATGAEDLGVIDSLCRHPYSWTMAIFADVRGLNVCRAFAGRLYAVMAANAVAGDSHVIEIGGHPGSRCVAVVAGGSACNVCWVLSGCCDAVVTTCAITNNTGMIKYGRSPRGGIVAVVALVAGRNMGWRFPGGLDAVVTSDTTAGYGGVVHKYNRAPAGRGMTVGTRSLRYYMVGRFR